MIFILILIILKNFQNSVYKVRFFLNQEQIIKIPKSNYYIDQKYQTEFNLSSYSYSKVIFKNILKLSNNFLIITIYKKYYRITFFIAPKMNNISSKIFF